jgi:hypothetical protein
MTTTLILLSFFIIRHTTDIHFRNGFILVLRSKVAYAHAKNKRAALRNGGTDPLILDFGTKWI